MNNTVRRKLLLIIFSTISVIAVFITANVFAQEPDAPGNASQEEERTYSLEQTDKSHYATLLEKVKAEGRIRIIVGVKAAFKPEGWHRTPEKVAEQRTGIARAQESLLKAVSILNESSIKKFKYTPFIAMAVDEATLQSLMNNPMVNSIEEDRLNSPMLYQTIPLIGANSGEANTYTGVGQTIAILDTGVDKTHPFLSGKVVEEACYSSASGAYGTSLCPNGQTSQTGSGAGVNCPSSVDGCEHGTHVAGIAAGKRTQCSDGTYCMRGVAPDANIIAIQVFSRFDNASECSNTGHSSPCALVYDSDYKSALEYVYSLRNAYTIASVNMSIGGQGYTINCDNDYSAIKADIDQLRSVGIATIIASGNNYYINGIDAPACISSAVSVGATGGLGTFESVTSYSNSASFLSLLAPGGLGTLDVISLTGIYSSIPYNSSYGYWGHMSGTSMAAPHVAGAWALMKQKNPAASVDTILSALQSTGKSFTDTRKDSNGVATNITKPRIQVDAALAALSAPSCTYAISPTSQSFTSSAGTGSVTVTPSSSSCSWTATESLDWVTITSGSSGTGSGTVSYSVSANTTGTSRTGNMTIAGQTFTITQSAASTPAATKYPVYRFASDHDHFFTISEDERNYIKQNLTYYTDEGVAFYAYQTQQSGTSPVYRFASDHDHFFTISEDERNYIKQNLTYYTDEGVAFYAYQTQQSGTSPVYRFASDHDHFFTISENERNYIKQNLTYYTDEGVAFYAYQTQ